MGEEFGEQDGEGIEVGTRVEGAGPSVVGVPEVGQQDRSVRPDEDVGRPEGSVWHTRLVCGFEDTGHRSDEGDDVVGGEVGLPVEDLV